MTRTWRNFLPYLFGGIWVATWWAIAFHGTPSTPHIPLKISAELDSVDTIFNRSNLQKALQGDLPLIESLLIHWQQTAESLKQEGVKPVLQLSPSELIQAFLLSQSLHHDPEVSSEKFFPQTYPAACFLLALIPPRNLSALPDGFHDQTALFPAPVLQQLPPHRLQYSLEHVWRTNPAAAFVSAYSNPALISALGHLHIPCLFLPNIYRIQQVEGVLKKIGACTGSPRKALLLSLFIKAALQAIDNEISAALFRTHQARGPLNPLLLFHYHRFSTPPQYSLTWELAERLGFQSFDDPQPCLNAEMLKKLDPDLLVIASQNPKILQAELSQLPFFATLNASQSVYWVDSSVQHSPSQFLVLAYYDLALPVLDYLKDSS